VRAITESSCSSRCRISSIVEIGRSPDRIVSFGVDSDNELHVVGFDSGLIYRIDASGADLAAVTTVHEVVPTARRAEVFWRHTLDRPAPSWIEPSFDDRSWSSAPGGFGTRGTPGSSVRTDWRSSDIWLRREFSLASVDAKALGLSVHHDEDADIYINGVLAARLPGFSREYEDVAIGPEARAAFREGKNVLAVHCHQNNGGQYIDVEIIKERSDRARPSDDK
jgi:hypothetical protein